MRPEKKSLERPVQHLYPLDLECDTLPSTTASSPVEANEIRTKRDAAVTTEMRIRNLAEDDS